MSYASNTAVTEDRSRSEIERMLLNYGADEFGYMTGRTEAKIQFSYEGMTILMSVPLPDRDDPKFTRTPSGRKQRTESAALNEWQKEVRRRWRSLCLVIKAMLVGVDDGVLKFEQAFMPYIVWGNGLTTSQILLPRLQEAIASGDMQKQLEILP